MTARARPADSSDKGRSSKEGASVTLGETEVGPGRLERLGKREGGAWLETREELKIQYGSSSTKESESEREQQVKQVRLCRRACFFPYLYGKPCSPWSLQLVPLETKQVAEARCRISVIRPVPGCTF